MLGIDAKTFRKWLQQANVPFSAHPKDARIKCLSAGLLTVGRLADMIGRKPIFLTGLIVFILGSALSGLAPSLPLLILARLFQGIGGALIFDTTGESWDSDLNEKKVMRLCSNEEFARNSSISVKTDAR